ncbi:autotransporter outer membrane beta-barrel domain-containing protein [Alienimonas californiensis]|uniref:Autotransporter-associated beta strand repeat protein n=1 Tax=Alienimonas californiensis TaxID=2527989 RepID=A0A517P8J6_9PLAN|nr:autotransporter outer membrane beta-barrel domain-containing protein [Alienimonas californiensis]QDT15698.1 Autotransporter-associated beta strand repeat protein [Alienimonas californiensis]
MPPAAARLLAPRFPRFTAAVACCASAAIAPAALAQTGQVIGKTVTTSNDETTDAATVSFREALGAVYPGGTGVRFDVPLFADPDVDPVIELNGAIPAGREDVRVDLEQGGRGIELLVRPNGGGQSAAGPHVLNPTFTGSGTVTADLGSGSAAELTLNGHNGHRLTKVVSGVVVAGTDTGFGRGLHLEAGAGGRLTGSTYLGQLTGDGTLNLGSHVLVLGIFPSNPGGGTAVADGPGYSSAFAGSLAGSSQAGLLKMGSGTVTLTGESTYGGGTSVLGGRLEVDSAAALGTGALQLGNGAELKLLGVLDDRPGHEAGPAFLRQLDLNGGGRIDLNGHDLLLGAGVSGFGGLVVHGEGELTLATANSYAGGTSVTDSTLVIAAGGALGSGDLFLNDATVRTAHTEGTLVYGGAIALGADGGTVETSGGRWTVTGGTAGGTLTKTGAGELRLGAAGTHKSTVVAGGTLAVTGLTALGAGTVTLDGGELFSDLAAGQDSVLKNAVALGAAGGAIRTDALLTVEGQLSGAGLLTKTGSGTLILARSNSMTGGILVSAGAVRADQTAALGSGPLTLAGGRLETAGSVTLGNGVEVAAAGGRLRTLDSDARVTLAGDVDLLGDLTLDGAGTFLFGSDAGTFNAAAGVTANALSGATVRVDTVAPGLNLAGGSRLIGVGEALGDVNAAGEIAPGADGTGGQTLSVRDDLTLQSGGGLRIDHTPAGTDLVAVGGAANLSGGTVTVDVGSPDAAAQRALARQIAEPGSFMDLTVLTAAGGITAGPQSAGAKAWSLTGSSSVVSDGGTDSLVVRLSRVANGAAVFANPDEAAAADALFTLMPNAEGPAADLFAAALLSDADAARPMLNGLTAARSGGLGGVSVAGAGAVRRTMFRALRPGGGGGGLFRGQSGDPLADAGTGAGGDDEFGFGTFTLGSDIGDGGDGEESEGVDPGVRTADAGDKDSETGVEKSSFTPGGRAARTRRSGPDLCWGGFAEGYVVGGEIGSGLNETEYLTGGAVFGIDRLVASGTRVGVLWGFGGTGAESGGGVDQFEADVSSWQLGLYGTKTAGRWHAAAAAVYGGDGYETTRTLRAGGQAFVADGETDGSSVTLAAESGYLLPIEWIDLQPLAGVQYVSSSRDGYRETGLGAADLLYGDASADSLRVQLGARAAKTLGDPGGFAVIPELRAWWFGEVAGSDSPAPIRFAAAPTLPAFTTVGEDGTNQWVFGGGLTGLLGRHVRLYAHYDLLLGEDSLSHAGTGGAELRW